MNRPPLLVLALAAALAGAALRFPAPSVNVAVSRVEYAFGQQIEFTLEASADAVIRTAVLFFLPAGADRTSIVEAPITPGTAVTARAVHRIADRPIAPFNRVEYWWQVVTETGEQLTTEAQSFVYEDNRFAWQRLERDGVEVHWFEGDVAFGQAGLDIAASSLRSISREIGAPPPDRVQVYIYADAAALQAGLQLGGRSWVSGHADPALGVVLVSAPPGLESRLELEREIPHELTHLLIHQIVGPAGYDNLPTWLNEGLAANSEGAPDPRYRLALDEAASSNSLLSLESLCGPFPVDYDQALLAYAQSESVVRFIEDRYGIGSLGRTLAAYADGASCATGVERGLGRPLAELQQEWLREGLRANPLAAALRALGPYLVLLLIGAVPWALLWLVPRRAGGRKR